MIIGYVKQDLLEALNQERFRAIVHGCNCFHTMGAGVAKAIAKSYPSAVEADRRQTIMGDISKLGRCSVTTVPMDKLIINGYTQYRPGKCPTEQLYTSIQKLFTTLNRDWQCTFMPLDHKHNLIAIPRIGAGIAGGDWKEIERIINESTPDIYIVVFDMPEASTKNLQLLSDIDEFMR